MERGPTRLGKQSIYGGPEEIEEERRLAYVGITRAREELIITTAQSRMLYGMTTRNRVSRFAAEIPKEFVCFTSSAMFAKPTTAWQAPTPQAVHRQAASFTPQAKETFKPGDRISHKTFGTGMVTASTSMGNDTLLEIAFDTVGTKKLMANFANISRA